MNHAEFVATLNDAKPPAALNKYLQVLWLDKKGRWEDSHNIAQDIHDNTGSRLHAYLHRKEGDNANARYWYNLAGKSLPKLSLEEEWEEMVKEFLD